MNSTKALKHKSILFKLNNNDCVFGQFNKKNNYTIGKINSLKNTWQWLIRKIHQI